jgi:hypothetical protein
MSEPIMLALIAIAGTGAGSVLTYFLTRKKSNAETLSLELGNAQKVITIWRELSEEQSEKISKQEELILKQSEQIKKLEMRIDDLIGDMKLLRENHDTLCKSCVYKQFYNENKNV